MAVTTSYELTATSLITSSLGDFSLTFDDADMDGLLSIDEVTSFSGILCFGPPCIFGSLFFDTLSIVPVIPSVADGSGSFWRFDPHGGLGVTPGGFSYVVSEILNGAVIPLPAPLLLLVTALAGLFGVSRLQRKAVAA